MKNNKRYGMTAKMVMYSIREEKKGRGTKRREKQSNFPGDGDQEEGLHLGFMSEKLSRVERG
jgi:hypothetical protein